VFARRTQWELGKNPLTLAFERIKAEGREYLDLTSSNPTACGIGYETRKILKALGKPESLRDGPDAFGSRRAREVTGRMSCSEEPS